MAGKRGQQAERGTDLKKETKKLLFDFQTENVKGHLEIFKTQDCSLEGSDPGLGKTFIAGAVAVESGRPVGVICTKPNLPFVVDVFKLFGANVLFVVNYETIRHGKYYPKWAEKNFETRKTCPYLQFSKESESKKFTWKLPPETLLIFDEAHLCKKPSTLLGQLLISTKDSCSVVGPKEAVQRAKVLLMTATPADKVENFKVFGYLMNFYSDLWHSGVWIRNRRKAKDLHDLIYPAKGRRLKLAELKGKLPENRVKAVCYAVDSKEQKEVTEAYKELEKAYKALRMTGEEKKLEEALLGLEEKKEVDKNHPLVRILRERQRIELLKVPVFVSLAEEYVEQGMSVIIFVSFNDSLNLLADQLKTTCVVRGGQSDAEREKNIKDFQEGKSRVIICNIRTGGKSISLHDTTGEHPRITLTNTPFSIIDLLQALGRAHRLGSLSAVLQLLVFISGTVEERIRDVINSKLDFMSELNDGDLKAFSIENLTDSKKE